MPTALILGATSDMAMAIAKEFAAHNYTIQLAARKPDQLRSLQSDLSVRFQTECSLHEFDAIDFASHGNFYSSLTPKPDVVICVFGYLGDADLARKNWNEAYKIIQSNYTGAVSILDIVANEFVQRGSGTIVGISSVAGERGRQSNYHYGSAKAGFTAYLSGLRNRMFPEGVHVLTVQPGFTYTRMTENLKLPPLLTGQPSDVAKAIYKGVINRRNVIYVKWMWRWIMLIIRSIPESMFKKMKM